MFMYIGDCMKDYNQKHFNPENILNLKREKKNQVKRFIVKFVVELISWREILVAFSQKLWTELVLDELTFK